MHLNIVWYDILLKYSQSRAELSLFFTSCLSLGLPEDFGSIAKRGWGGLLALKSPIICSSIKSCMKTKGDMVCFTLNSVFLIVQKNDDCAEEKDAGLLVFFFFFFFFFFLLLFVVVFVCVCVCFFFFLRFDLQFFPPFLLFFSFFPLPLFGMKFY